MPGGLLQVFVFLVINYYLAGACMFWCSLRYIVRQAWCDYTLPCGKINVRIPTGMKIVERDDLICLSPNYLNSSAIVGRHLMGQCFPAVVRLEPSSRGEVKECMTHMPFQDEIDRVDL